VKSSDTHNLQDIELVEKLKEAREESFNLRLRHATGELEDTSGLSRAKKDVARLLTIARQRNIDLEREQGASK
jgi:large subunit ribosomal protein L29